MNEERMKDLVNIHLRIRKLIQSGRYQVIDRELMIIAKDMEIADSNILIAYLVATGSNPVKRKLNYRKDFFKQVKQELRARKELSAGLLDDLK